MSIYLPECNAQITGTGGSVRLTVPAGASFKAANRGFVIGCFAKAPVGGYTQTATHNLISRFNGLTGGGDGYLRFTNTGGTLEARFRQGGADTLVNTQVTGLTAGTVYLVMLLATATSAHLVACPVGGSPTVTTVASNALYALNQAAVDCFGTIGIGAAAANGHYGPIEEAFFLTGEFPESAGVPDNTLIQNIANGTQDLDTLVSQLANGAEKWRYRLRLASDMSDAFGVAGNLTAVNTTADKVILSSGPLRPVELAPDMTYSCDAQAQFSSPYTLAGATATVRTEGGAYTGAAPSAIQCRLVKEDQSVYVNWVTVDAAPSAGRWAAGQISGVPPVSGRLTREFRKVDGSGAQIGEIIASHGLTGSGLFVVPQGQSQLDYLADVGNGVAVPSNMRLTVHYFKAGVLKTFQVSDLNLNSRVARGLRQLGIELNTLYPGVPITIASLAVSGQSLEAFFGAGAHAGKWGEIKTRLGIVQPFYLMMCGHGNASSTSYQSDIVNAIAKCVSDLGTPIKTLHLLTARYAGAGSGGSYVACNDNRIAIRAHVAANPSDNMLVGSLHAIKSTANDVGPHPADNNVGQGRSGAAMAWGLMMACRAVEDEPLVLAKATILPGGTVDELDFAPLASTITGVAAGSFDFAGAADGDVIVAGAGAGSIGLSGSADGDVVVSGAGSGSLGLAGNAGGNVSGGAAVSGSGVGSLDLSGGADGDVIAEGDASTALSMAGSASGTTASGTAVAIQYSLPGRWRVHRLLANWRAAA